MTQKEALYDSISKKIDRLAEVSQQLDDDIEAKIEYAQILQELDSFEYYIQNNPELYDELQYIKARNTEIKRWKQ